MGAGRQGDAGRTLGSQPRATAPSRALHGPAPGSRASARADRGRSGPGRAQALLTCLLLLLAVVPTVAAGPAPGDVNVMLDKPEALAALFPEADEVVEKRHVLSRSQLATIEKRLSRRLDEGGFYLYRARRDGRLLGHAVVVSQIGKVRPITHIVEVLPDGTVGTVAVMIYRESHGDEVAAPTFMEQYRGKGLDDPIRVDRDIINIAGATLSAHAICRGVRKALIVVDELCVDPEGGFWDEAGDVTPPALQPDRDLVTSLDGGTALRVERQVMGTVCRVEAYLEDSGLDAAGLEAACRAALDEVSRWDDVLSTWRDDTPLARLNAAPVQEPVDVDPDLLAWLDDASRWRQATGAAFDPAVGALVEAWGLRTGTPCRPTPERLAAALAASGLERLSRQGGRLSRQADGLALDPGASGKGWALDRAAAVLAGRGVTRALLSFRSTLLALGPPPRAPGLDPARGPRRSR